MEEGITDWHYEMIFSENFFTIDSGSIEIRKIKFVDFQINKIVIELLKGQVKHLDKNGEVVRVSKFGKNHFEASLVYRIDLEGQIKKKIGQEMTKNDIWLNYTKET